MSYQNDIPQEDKLKAYVERKGWDHLLRMAHFEVCANPVAAAASKVQYRSYYPLFNNQSKTYWLEDQELEQTWNIGFHNINIKQIIVDYGGLNTPILFFGASFNDIDFHIGATYSSSFTDETSDEKACVTLLIDDEVVLSIDYQATTNCHHGYMPMWHMINVQKVKKDSKTSALLNGIGNAIRWKEVLIEQHKKTHGSWIFESSDHKFSLKAYEFEKYIAPKTRELKKIVVKALIRSFLMLLTCIFVAAAVILGGEYDIF
jgi:hypothetical protein